MTHQLPIASGSGCTCGARDEGIPVLDARALPHQIRHASILGALDGIGAGQAMRLIAPHRPTPLLRQIDQRFGGAFAAEIESEEEGRCVVLFTRAS